jgi:hypothetical protein
MAIQSMPMSTGAVGGQPPARRRVPKRTTSVTQYHDRNSGLTEIYLRFENWYAELWRGAGKKERDAAAQAVRAARIAAIKASLAEKLGLDFTTIGVDTNTVAGKRAIEAVTRKRKAPERTAAAAAGAEDGWSADSARTEEQHKTAKGADGSSAPAAAAQAAGGAEKATDPAHDSKFLAAAAAAAAVAADVSEQAQVQAGSSGAGGGEGPSGPPSSAAPPSFEEATSMPAVAPKLLQAVAPAAAVRRPWRPFWRPF